MRVFRFFRLSNDNPFTGLHMLVVVLLFFGVVVGVNIVLAVAATGSFPGLVVKNSYVASQHYNDLLAEARARAGAAWRLELDAPDGVLVARLVDRDGTLHRRLAVTALAGRPSSTREDRLIEFTADVGGFRATEALPPGQWEVDIEARQAGELVYRELRRVFVRPDGET